jgi:hypothetical protein
VRRECRDDLVRECLDPVDSGHWQLRVGIVLKTGGVVTGEALVEPGTARKCPCRRDRDRSYSSMRQAEACLAIEWDEMRKEKENRP